MVDFPIAYPITASPAYNPAIPRGLILPTSVPNNALWLDPADPAVLTESLGSLSQWDDKSGNDNHAVQGTASAQFLTGSETVNGKNVMVSASGDFMTLTSGIDYSGGVTMIAVVLPDNTADSKTIIGGNTGSPQIRLDADENLDVVRTAQAVVLTGTTPVSVANASIVIGVSDASGNTTYINGGPAVDTNATDPAYTANIDRISANESNAFNFEGKLGDILAYTGVLSAAHLNMIGAQYLAPKWGMSWTNI